MAIYIALYVLLCVWALFEDIRIEAPRWKLALRGLGNGLGSAGMILYAMDAVVPALSAAWRFVFPLLVVEAVVDGVWDVRKGVRRHLAKLADVGGDEARRGGGEARPGDVRRILVFSIAVGVLISIPYFVVNFLVAYRSP